MNHSLGTTQRKKSMEEWLAPELRDTVKGVIVTRTMKVLAGEFALIVTKEDIKQTSADTIKATTRALNTRLINFIFIVMVNSYNIQYILHQRKAPTNF